jgi:hypothetical protein
MPRKTEPKGKRKPTALKPATSEPDKGTVLVTVKFPKGTTLQFEFQECEITINNGLSLHEPFSRGGAVELHGRLVTGMQVPPPTDPMDAVPGIAMRRFKR